MADRPTITTGLRDAVHRYNKYSSMTMPCESQTYVKTDAETFDRMCDAIDAIHAQLERDYKVACRVGKGLAEHCENSLALPLDADGVPIRIGDVMEWPDGETFDVIGIGDGVLFYTESECDGPAEWTGVSTKRHHHAPTVEDVLREFAYGLGVPVADSYIAASAAKLKLAEKGGE